MSSYTVRKPCNHGLHLFLTIITLGMWGVFVWPFAAVMGRKETVRFDGYPAAPLTGPYPPPVRRAPYALPQPQPNAMNPYNGQPYFDARQGLRAIEYPPGHPVQYGR